MVEVFHFSLEICQLDELFLCNLAVKMHYLLTLSLNNKLYRKEFYMQNKIIYSFKINNKAAKHEPQHIIFIQF